MTDALTVISELQGDLEALDRLGKAIYRAADELSQAEEAWEELWDAVAESLRDDMHEQGRKGDPAEHVILSETRKQHRAAYQRYRRAKRDLERLQLLSQVRRQQCSGRQSELAALRDEVGLQQHAQQPAWSGGRRAA
jgi:hypothetical protein